MLASPHVRIVCVNSKKARGGMRLVKVNSRTLVSVWLVTVLLAGANASSPAALDLTAEVACSPNTVPV